MCITYSQKPIKLLTIEHLTNKSFYYNPLLYKALIKNYTL